MTIKIREASPRALKKITLDFADGSSIEGVVTKSHFSLVGLVWCLELHADLSEMELRTPIQERLGLLDSGSLIFTPLQDGYIVETS